MFSMSIQNIVLRNWKFCRRNPRKGIMIGTKAEVGLSMFQRSLQDSNKLRSLQPLFG